MIQRADLAERVTWLAAPLPWAANLFRLVSLWDMLRVHVDAFVKVMGLFRELEQLCDKIPKGLVRRVPPTSTVTVLSVRLPPPRRELSSGFIPMVDACLFRAA